MNKNGKTEMTHFIISPHLLNRMKYGLGLVSGIIVYMGSHLRDVRHCM